MIDLVIMLCNLVVHSRMYRRSTAAAGGACSRVLAEEDAEEGVQEGRNCGRAARKCKALDPDHNAGT